MSSRVTLPTNSGCKTPMWPCTFCHSSSSSPPWMTYPHMQTILSAIAHLDFDRGDPRARLWGGARPAVIRPTQRDGAAAPRGPPQDVSAADAVKGVRLVTPAHARSAHTTDSRRPLCERYADHQ